MRWYIDLETRSFCDLSKSGVYPYSSHPTTEILCGVVAKGDGPPVPYVGDDIINMPLPTRTDDVVVAHNANFERVVLGQLLGNVPPIGQWVCTMAKCSYHGLPKGLDAAAKALDLRYKKDARGTQLINKLSKPKKGKFVEDSEALAEMVEYCIQDVVVTREIDQHLDPLPPFEQYLYQLDQRINDAGMLVDMDLVKAAMEIYDWMHARGCKKLERLTDGVITTPNQNLRFVQWLREHGVPVNSVDKATVELALSKQIPPLARQVLEVRKRLSNSAVKKYYAMKDRTNGDGRARGTFMYYGGHTGRWSGRGVQFQNIARGTLNEAETDSAIKTIKKYEPDFLELIYDNPAETLSSCVRSALLAPKGKALAVIDFAQIETRVLAWVADQRDMLEAFVNGDDIYKEMACRIFNTSLEEVTSEQRFIGKQSVLGMGYGMGWEKFQNQCQRFGVTISGELADRSVHTYRKTFKNIQNFWFLVQNKLHEAIADIPQKVGPFSFKKHKADVRVEFPVGRHMTYRNARIDPEGGLMFDPGGPGLKPLIYGGRITENLVQGLARDVLAAALLRVDRAGYRIVMHVHDEVVVECNPGEYDAIEKLVAEVPPWAKGLPIEVEGFETQRYRK